MAPPVDPNPVNAMILTLICVQSMGDYWLRHIRTYWTEEFSQSIDEEVKTFFNICTDMDTAP